MKETQFDKNLIAKNSIFLVIRMLITMWINLYTTRLILQGLGLEDYGTYGLIGGVVSMFTVFTGGITNAINRFLSYEIGKGSDKFNIQITFCNCLNVVVFFVILSLIILEIIGVWFLNNKLQIPLNKITEANWVFQFSIITSMIGMLSIPYNALIIAREKMNAFAFISLLQVILNFIVAISIGLFSGERLFYYGLFLCIIGIIIRLIYQIYCRVKFDESKYIFNFDIKKMKEIGKFTGISIIDGIIVLLFSQGYNVLLNLNYGVAINGVFSIANQVRNSALAFSQNVQKAIEPQIIKTYSNGEIKKYKNLILEGSRLQYYILILILCPLIVRSEQILKIWIGDTTDYTSSFVIILLFVSALYAITCPIITGAMATGRIKKFLLYTDSVYVISIVVLFILYKFEIILSPTNYILIFLIIESIIALFRIYIFSEISYLNIKSFVFRSVLHPSFILIISLILSYLINKYYNDTIGGLILFILTSLSLTMILIIMFGLNNQERHIIKNISLSIKKRILCKIKV